MILNLKYFKRQMGDPTIKAKYQIVSKSNPRKALVVITLVQLLIQFSTFTCLVCSFFNQWNIENYEKNKNTEEIKIHGNTEKLFHMAMMFLFCDCGFSVIAKIKLNKTSLWFNNVKHVKTWQTMNCIYYLLLSISYVFIFLTTKKENNTQDKTALLYLVYVHGATILVFYTTKMHIIYTMYMEEKSSFIFLEQSPVSIRKNIVCNPLKNGYKPLEVKKDVTNNASETNKPENFKQFLAKVNVHPTTYP